MPYISSLIISFSLFINISTKHISSNAQDIHINSLPMYNEYAPPIPAPQANTISPSGKLAQSIPLDISDDPSTLNWPGEEGHVDYGEGVFPILMYALMDSIALLIFPMHIVLAYG